MSLDLVKFCHGFPAPMYRPLEVQGHLVSAVEIWSRRSDEDIEEVSIKIAVECYIYKYFRFVIVPLIVHCYIQLMVTSVALAFTCAGLICRESQATETTKSQQAQLHHFLTKTSFFIYFRLNLFAAFFWCINTYCPCYFK